MFLWVIIIYLYIKLKRINENINYSISEYYNQSSFPMRIVYKTNGIIINRATACIQYAILHFNEVLEYELFTLEDTNKNALIITMQNTTYAHGCSSTFDGKNGILAHATLPPERLLCIDASENWNSKKDNNKLLKRVLLHELGHILGLYHAFNENSIMSYNDVYSLQTYDIHCLRKLYPFLLKK